MSVEARLANVATATSSRHIRIGKNNKLIELPKPKRGVSSRYQIRLARKMGYDHQIYRALGLYGDKKSFRHFYFTNKNRYQQQKHTYVQKMNIDQRTFYSNAMDACITFKANTKVIRTIDHKGGFDNYLLTTKHKLGPRALATKRMIAERIEQLKAEGKYTPFPGVPDAPEFPTTFDKALKLDAWVRKTRQGMTKKSGRGLGGNLDLKVFPEPLLPHKVAGLELLME